MELHHLGFFGCRVPPLTKIAGRSLLCIHFSIVMKYRFLGVGSEKGMSCMCETSAVLSSLLVIAQRASVKTGRLTLSALCVFEAALYLKVFNGNRENAWSLQSGS